MIYKLQPIQIKELKALSSPKIWEFNIFLKDLKSLTPVKGIVDVIYQETTIRAKGDF